MDIEGGTSPYFTFYIDAKALWRGYMGIGRDVSQWQLSNYIKGHWRQNLPVLKVCTDIRTQDLSLTRFMTLISYFTFPGSISLLKEKGSIWHCSGFP